MIDRIYKWFFRRSIRKYSYKSKREMYYNTIKAISSGKYNGYILHRLWLQKSVLASEVLKNA